MINILADFMVQNFGLYPTNEQKKAVSVAAINLFSAFRVQSSEIDGIVSIHNECVFVMNFKNIIFPFDCYQ